MIAWHTLLYKPQNCLVVGTYLAAGFVDPTKRFAVYERRSRSWDGIRYYPSVTYVVKDADTVTNAQVTAGKLPTTVFSSDDLDACVGYVENRMRE